LASNQSTGPSQFDDASLCAQHNFVSNNGSSPANNGRPVASNSRVTGK
jgi:hypothetical protein